MLRRPNPENFVDKSLPDLFNASEVNDYFFEAFKSSHETFGLGTTYEAYAEPKEPDDSASFRKEVIFV